MKSDKTRPVGIALAGLVLLASLLFLASPAGADSVGPNANHGSVSSGSGHADWGSTASGDSVAVNGSTSSGCATAANGSTASGGVCPPPTVAPTPVHPAEKAHRAAVVHARERAGRARAAVPVTSRRLAVTGSTTGPLAAAAAGLVLVGTLMVALTSERRRTLQHS